MEDDEAEHDDAEEIDAEDNSKEFETKPKNPFKRSSEEISQSNMKRVKKDPTVDTSFLPDREREEEENHLREELRQQWANQQQKLKEEEIDVTFSYWDGSGHRKTVRVKKGIFRTFSSSTG